MYTCEILSGGMEEREMASWMAIDPSRGAETSLKTPLKTPQGVRAAERM